MSKQNEPRKAELRRLQFWSSFGVLLIAFIACGGCNEPAPGEPETPAAAEAPKLPKMSFHKPESLSDAVERLDQILAAATAEGELPAAKQFTVVEIIHGTGSSAHSHFHLAEDGDSAEVEEMHDHHEGEEDEKTHQIEVDVMTEFVDVARWIPDLAADSELSEEKWGAVKEAATQLSDMLKSMPDSDIEAGRQFVRDRAEKIAPLLQQLKTAMTDG